MGILYSLTTQSRRETPRQPSLKRPNSPQCCFWGLLDLQDTVSSSPFHTCKSRSHSLSPGFSGYKPELFFNFCTFQTSPITWIHYLNSSFPFLSLPKMNFKKGPLVISQPDLILSFKLCSFHIYWLSFSLVYRPCSILRFLAKTKQFSPGFPLLISIDLLNKSLFHHSFPKVLLISLARWNPLIIPSLHCSFTFIWFLVNIFLLH